MSAIGGKTAALLSGLSSEAERTGGAAGATIGTFVIVFFWTAASLILGLCAFFTRGKKDVIEERTDD